MDKLLEMEICEDSFRWSLLRSGNPHALRIVRDRTPLPGHFLGDGIYSRAAKLGNAPAGSGHDCYLKGISVLVDWYCTQTIHRQLLRYSFIEVVSSMSLMHSAKEIVQDDFLMQKVSAATTQHIRQKLADGENIMYDIPMGVLLGVSFRMSFMSAKTIYNQRKNHPLKEWRDFCDMLEDLPYFREFCLGGNKCPT